MNKIYISNSCDPYTNIAFEKYLLDNAQDNIILYLWQNCPCVIAGINQNTYKEWNLPYIKSKNILPVRRYTGGGAVYHDLGNLNFSFISKEKNEDTEKWLNIILDAVKTFDIDCCFGGRNDLMAQGKKFGGTAWLKDNDNVLFHGTVMVKVNIESLVESLTPSSIKFNGKSVDSVKARVTNLSQISSQIDILSVKKEIAKYFLQAYPDTDYENCFANSEVSDIADILSSDNWIYKKNPDCSIFWEETINGQNVSIYFKLQDNIIKEVKVYTDSLDIELSEKIEKILLETAFEKNDFKSFIEKNLILG